jgi:hypothetical protein
MRVRIWSKDDRSPDAVERRVRRSLSRCAWPTPPPATGNSWTAPATLTTLDDGGRWLEDGMINSATPSPIDLLARYVTAADRQAPPALAWLSR